MWLCSDLHLSIGVKITNFVQGTAQGGVGANWGDGFCCDANLVKRLGLSDPKPLFSALMSRPYRDQARASTRLTGRHTVLMLTSST